MGAATASPKQAIALGAQREFMCVPLAVFRLSRTNHVDLYCMPEGLGEPILYCSSNLGVTDKDIDILKSRGHRALYVRTAEYAALDRRLNDSLSDILENDSVSVEERLAILQTAAAIEVDVAFQMIKCDRFVALTQRIAGQIGELLEGNAVEPKKLFSMVQHDFYTFTHITNVASFATLLAQRLGMPVDEVRQITLAGLLHDIGKRFVPSAVLCKNGKPTDDEWALIKSHPQRGYEDLCHRDDLSFGQLMGVYSHHERPDGKGYPVGLVDAEIHPWAKLMAVVDVFDALTSARPYRSPMKLSEALAYLERNSGTQFDEEMARCWISTMRQG